MPKTRIVSPYPRFAEVISRYEMSHELARNTSLRWRNGNIGKTLLWLVRRPETLLALYEDSIEQYHAQEKET